jgi:hypothetical protein
VVQLERRGWVNLRRAEKMAKASSPAPRKRIEVERSIVVG